MCALDIKGIIRDAISALSVFHFRIIAIIGDGAQCYRQFQRRYFIDKRVLPNGKAIDNFMTHPIIGNPIFYISDTSHMAKKIVSSLSSPHRNIFKKNGKRR